MQLHGNDSINRRRIKQKAQILKSGRLTQVLSAMIVPLKTESNQSASALMEKGSHVPRESWLCLFLQEPICFMTPMLRKCAPWIITCSCAQKPLRRLRPPPISSRRPACAEQGYIMTWAAGDNGPLACPPVKKTFVASHKSQFILTLMQVHNAAAQLFTP